MGTQDRSTSGKYVGRYICIDPGEETGLSLLEVTGDNEPPKILRTGSIVYRGFAIREALCRFYYHGFDPADGFAATHQVRGLNKVILEKFVHRPGKPFNPTAYKVMGICEGWHQEFQNGGDPMFEYVERMPVQGKSEADNNVLRRLGLYLPGHAQRHINDATRHGVSWLLERHHRGTALVAKPKEEDD